VTRFQQLLTLAVSLLALSCMPDEYLKKVRPSFSLYRRPLAERPFRRIPADKDDRV
jgi:hypothetical protein